VVVDCCENGLLFAVSLPEHVADFTDFFMIIRIVYLPVTPVSDTVTCDLCKFKVRISTNFSPGN